VLSVEVKNTKSIDCSSVSRPVERIPLVALDASEGLGKFLWQARPRKYQDVMIT
jgi:hypothetical protein